MRFCHAHRRYALHPNSRDPGNLATDDHAEAFLRRATAMGFVLALQGPHASLSSGDAALGIPAGAALDGETDYRFALSAMRAAGYAGFVAIEGAAAGEQFHAGQKGLTCAKAVWAELGRRPRR